MSGVTREWLALLIFLLCFFGFTIGETIWLNKKTQVGFGKSLAFAALTNFLGFSIGFFVVFVIVGVILAMAWDGSIEKFPLNDYGLVITLILATLFTPALLTLLKRLLFFIFKLQSGKTAWLFSIASSVLIFIVSLGLPVIFLYLF
jgi:hypothetical protein